MLASDSTHINEKNVFPVNKFGINNLLKSAAIFGANASGKSNFINSIRILQNIILNSLTEANNLETVVPFLLKKDVFDIPSEFEITFVQQGQMYRYGISILKGKIDEEWLYWTKTSKEIFLFQRTGQTIKINKRSFTEAKDFIKEKNGKLYLEKTRENVPFVSVLSQFNGEKSHHIIEWFRKLHVVSGINEEGFKKFTINLLDQNPAFLTWALNILGSLQIKNIHIVESNQENTTKLFNGAVSMKTRNKSKKVEIVKKIEGSEQAYNIPLILESQGTQKLIYLLGPIFHIINTGEILLIDEFDNKFHSLLSQFILGLYHKENNNKSQLIVTCHDTNLLTRDLFRRDQIWFLDKNSKQESELYSLLEYKEHYTRQNNSYSKDYLAGKYGAIPLFKSIDELEIALNE
ncbi:ATP-binding protein [Candidatus Halobeggiatoa sp. HSG11]|nr:ATP-binding protein [Candidatus Halobeggiatoa sp. HSG11]